MTKIIAAIGTHKSTLVFQLVEFKGVRTFDIRKHFVESSSGDLVPTRKGISLAEKTFAVVRNVLREHDSEIQQWLDKREAISKLISNENSVYENAQIKAKFDQRTLSVARRKWASPEFFYVEALGDLDRLSLNEQHPFVDQFYDLLERLSEENDVEKRRDLTSVITSMFESLLHCFERSRRLLADATITDPGIFLETLIFNWGTYLKRSSDKDGESSE